MRVLFCKDATLLLGVGRGPSLENYPYNIPPSPIETLTEDLLDPFKFKFKEP